MKAVVKIYLKTGGAGFEYIITARTKKELTVKAREHLGAIQQGGYRHCSNGILEWFPPHWIDKIKIVGNMETSYPDSPFGT